jgi:hypothetical protein
MFSSLLHYYDTLDTITYKTKAPTIVIFNDAQVDDVSSALDVVKELHQHRPNVFVLLIAFDQQQITSLSPLVDFSMYFQSDFSAAANWILNTLCR